MAGYGSSYLEKPLKNLLPNDIKFNTVDVRVSAFIISLLLMSFVALEGQPFFLILGGGLGFFNKFSLKMGKSALNWVKRQLGKDKDISTTKDAKKTEKSPSTINTKKDH